MSWETEAIGAKQQLETAKKLRDMAIQAPQGQMVGNVFVAPHWTQHLAHALRNLDVDRREQEALGRLEGADRQQNLATIQAMNAAGLEAPQALLAQAQEKPIQPGMIDRFSAFLRGEEAKPTQPAAIQQNIARNLTPEQKEAALMQLSFVNPEVGKSLIDHEISKRKLEEANADRDAMRQLTADKFASMYGVRPGELGAIVGGRQILGNGQVVTLPKVGTGSGAVSGQSTGESHSGGTGGAPDRRDMRLTTVNGQRALVNVRTGEIRPLGDAGTAGQPSGNPKYDSSSDQWVYPPSADHPAGMVTPAPGKIGALENFNVMADKLTPTVNALDTGGLAGYKKYTAPIFQKDLSDTFDNRVEQLSGEARKIMRIPGEGTLSDKEQAQYGLQLPNKKFSPEVNAQIIKDLKERMKTSVAPSGVSVPVPEVQAPANSGWSIREK